MKKTLEELELLSDEELLDYRDYCVKQSEYHSMMSDLLKLNLNSLYGAISNPYSRFYSIFLAASVTSTGQAIEKHQTMMADKIVQERCNE